MFILFISKQIFAKHFLTAQIFRGEVIFEIDMGNCESNEYQISFWHCESCGADVDDNGFVEIEHRNFCSINQTIQDLRSKLNESRKINSSISQKGKTVLACSETAQRRIQDLEAEITGLNSEINLRNAKIPELMRRLTESEKQNSSLVQKNQTVMLCSDTAQKRIKDLETKITGLNSEINSLNLKLDETRKHSSDVQAGKTVMPWSENSQKRTPSLREVVLEEETTRLKNEIISLNAKINEKSDSKITRRSKSKPTERSRSWQYIKKGIHKINGCHSQNW